MRLSKRPSLTTICVILKSYKVSKRLVRMISLITFGSIYDTKSFDQIRSKLVNLI